jgi:hypothetical protein
MGGLAFGTDPVMAAEVIATVKEVTAIPVVANCRRT